MSVDYYTPTKPVEEGIEDALSESEQVANEIETLRSRGIVHHEPSHRFSRT